MPFSIVFLSFGVKVRGSVHSAGEEAVRGGCPRRPTPSATADLAVPLWVWWPPPPVAQTAPSRSTFGVVAACFWAVDSPVPFWGWNRQWVDPAFAEWSVHPTGTGGAGVPAVCGKGVTLSAGPPLPPVGPRPLLWVGGLGVSSIFPVPKVPDNFPLCIFPGWSVGGRVPASLAEPWGRPNGACLN